MATRKKSDDSEGVDTEGTGGPSKRQGQGEGQDEGYSPGAARPGLGRFDLSGSGVQRLIEDVATRASEIVGKSATILEEEIASGILAAKQIEQKFIDIEAVRGGSEQRFGRRVRRDVHEVADIIIDLVETGIKSAGTVALRAVRITPAAGSRGRRPPKGNIPTLSPSGPVSAGGTAEIRMTLENESDVDADEFSFQASDLVNAASGEGIPAERVTVSPTPVTIAPRGQSDVTVKIAIPDGTARGLYSGLLQATSLDQLRAILSVSVE